MAAAAATAPPTIARREIVDIDAPRLLVNCRVSALVLGRKPMISIESISVRDAGEPQRRMGDQGKWRGKSSSKSASASAAIQSSVSSLSPCNGGVEGPESR